MEDTEASGDWETVAIVQQVDGGSNRKYEFLSMLYRLGILYEGSKIIPGFRVFHTKLDPRTLAIFGRISAENRANLKCFTVDIVWGVHVGHPGVANFPRAQRSRCNCMKFSIHNVRKKHVPTSNFRSFTGLYPPAPPILARAFSLFPSLCVVIIFYTCSFPGFS